MRKHTKNGVTVEHLKRYKITLPSCSSYGEFEAIAYIPETASLCYQCYFLQNVMSGESGGLNDARKLGIDHGMKFSWGWDSDIVILETLNTKNTMTHLEKFTLAFKAEPEKSFRKAGITNGDDFLTDDGQKIFLSWLLKKNGEAFKKEVVDGLLEDDKDAK